MRALQSQSSQLAAIVPNLRRYARALIGEQKHADELVRDTLEQACCLAAVTACGRDPRSCLLGILHRRYLSSVGRTPSSLGDLMETRPSPEDAALQSLPQEQRAILLLTVLEQMSIQQVADVIDRPPAWVATSLTSSREKLRTQLDTAGFAPLP